MALEVTPEDFPAVTAQLQAIHTDLMGVLTGTAGPAKPIAAASDAVSQLAATKFAAYHTAFYGQASPGLTNLLDGAQVLVPVASDYTNSDLAGGGTVGAAGNGPVIAV